MSDTKKGKLIDQTYFFDNLGSIRLIYPIQSTQSIKSALGAGSKNASNYEKIVDSIKKQNEVSIDEQSNPLILYFNNKIGLENNKSTV